MIERKRREEVAEELIRFVDLAAVCTRYSIGIRSARELGTAADAAVKIGRATRYDLRRIDSYLLGGSVAVVAAKPKSGKSFILGRLELR